MKKIILVVSVFTLVLVACGPAAVPTEAMMDKPTEAMMDKPTEAMMDKPTDAMIDKPTETMGVTVTPEAMSGDTMMKSPEWFSAPLTNVVTGEAFMLKDYAGKVVVVELMAMWCPTCKRQQGEVKAMLGQLGMPADLIVVALDIDPNEEAAALKTYAAANGFDWMYAVAGADVARELGLLYGAQFLNPPSAPMLLIDRKGEVHPLSFGVKSAEDLLKEIKPLLEGGM